MFQSTHPRGVRREWHYPKRHHGEVSIHAPAWGATLNLILILTFLVFQSTHPRGVRLEFRGVFPEHLRVSIHAPAWGATLSQRELIESSPVSIHAPAWGATFANIFALTIFCVSIHAPAWGATHSMPFLYWDNKKFQSTHPRGVRPGSSLVSNIFGMFQSTHPRGVRQSIGFN